MGLLFEGGGGNREGGVINFTRRGENFNIFYPKVCLFMLFNDEISPLLLINPT